MFRAFASVYGVVFLLLGVLGFFRFLQSEDLLFHVFKVNVALNILYLITALTAFWIAFLKDYYARLYFQIIGFIYALIAALGFLYEDDPVLGFFASNAPNTWLHVVIAVVALILGFSTKSALKKRNRR